MVPSKLLRHIETNHREQMNNPISYFENIRSSFQKQSKKFKKFITTSDEAQTASYMIAQLIARKKKAHAEAEEIILPALKIVAGCMLTNDAMEKVAKIPLSSKTIARRIEDMSEDIELQIKQYFNDSSTKWAIQLDETTDISNKAQLLAFLRFVDTGKIVNNYFFCKELKQRTTGADIFELVDENVMKYNLRWENCVSVCTDGAPAMKVQENPSKSIIKKEVEETLTLLSASFDKYFPYLDVEKMEWVVSPFMHCEIQHLEEEMQENLIDLKNDLVFKRLFTEKELSEFWLCLNSKFPKLSNAAIESLLPFGSSYLCEQGFSTLTEMKSKKRERLQMIDEKMRHVWIGVSFDKQWRPHWLEQGNVAIYRNVSATRVTSARVDRRILRQAVAAPQATCTAILQHVQDTLDHSISTRTISRRLVANGLHSCRPLRRLPLTPPNRRQLLEWCRARSTWMTEWHRVVFSDESRFCLSSDSRRVRVWRRRGERSNPAAIVERPTVRQRGIIVWGAIAYDSRSPLLRIQGTMTAQRYVDDVLRPVTLPYLQGVPNALYQQDNARPHTARISQQVLQDVEMLPWPPYSPDLSPIEHVWDIIGRRLHALPQPRSEDELWMTVVYWSNAVVVASVLEWVQARMYCTKERDMVDVTTEMAKSESSRHQFRGELSRDVRKSRPQAD
ncbi:hypothetical protein LAZ67_23001097 [Cordylochernes scorpioides]|uniref:Transposase n=1 Tax=Cordylochernes scorpioides TaxID=51811 RepID=A0ABY6LQF9_9ARAC|nr:hypothetical protein LAZ67_23001097 [Cordylochernes scorpioides]